MDRKCCADPENVCWLVWPAGSLLGGQPRVSARKRGFPFSFPFYGGSVFAAFKAPL